jgi:hypothetical protein
MVGAFDTGRRTAVGLTIWLMWVTFPVVVVAGTPGSAGNLAQPMNGRHDDLTERMRTAKTTFDKYLVAYDVDQEDNYASRTLDTFRAFRAAEIDLERLRIKTPRLDSAKSNLHTISRVYSNYIGRFNRSSLGVT